MQDWHQQEFLSRLCETVDWVFSSTEKKGSYWAFYLPREPVLKILNGLCVRSCLWGWSNPPLTRREETVCTDHNLAPAGQQINPPYAEALAQLWRRSRASPFPPPSPQNKGRSFSAPPRVRCTHTPSITINSRNWNTTQTHPQHAQNQCHQYPERAYQKCKTKQTYSKSKYSKQQGSSQTHYKVNTSKTSSSTGRLIHWRAGHYPRGRKAKCLQGPANGKVYTIVQRGPVRSWIAGAPGKGIHIQFLEISTLAAWFLNGVYNQTEKETELNMGIE